MSGSKAGAFLPLVLFLGLPAAAEDRAPMSAIDWLSKSVATPAGMPAPGRAVNEPPVTTTTTIPGAITTRPLDGKTLDTIGLLPQKTTGLPADLWGTTPTADLVRQVRAERADTLPSVQALLYTLLLAEIDPPRDAGPEGELFLARVDKLLDLGALEPALSMLEKATPPSAEPFRRWFDVALLTGQEDRACTVMRDTPEVAPTFPARVFCLARGGDWNAAALSLRTGETLGYVDADMARLLEHFLDPDLFEGEPDLPPPARPSPLVFRLMEAIGQPMPTSTLPVAFAQADLRSNAGWKTRLEAAERLTRTGAIPANQLLGLYTENEASASGGIWDRVDAIQTLDAAMTARKADRIAAALSAAWPQMTDAELEVPFAEMFADRLAEAKLQGAAGTLAFRIGLLSEGYEKVALSHRAETAEEAFLVGVATGKTDGLTPGDQMGVAVKSAFLADAPLREDYRPFMQDKRLGEGILKAIDDITEGARGDLRDVTGGLRFLREAGLEENARRAALELLLLERRG
jgi:hypothetical protein